MTLREVLIRRFSTRVRHRSDDRDAADTLDELEAGRPVAVTAHQLAAALWEQGAVDAAEHNALVDGHGAPLAFVVATDGTFTAV